MKKTLNVIIKEIESLNEEIQINFSKINETLNEFKQLLNKNNDSFKKVEKMQNNIISLNKENHILLKKLEILEEKLEKYKKESSDTDKSTNRDEQMLDKDKYDKVKELEEELEEELENQLLYQLKKIALLYNNLGLTTNILELMKNINGSNLAILKYKIPKQILSPEHIDNKKEKYLKLDNLTNKEFNFRNDFDNYCIENNDKTKEKTKNNTQYISPVLK